MSYSTNKEQHNFGETPKPGSQQVSQPHPDLEFTFKLLSGSQGRRGKAESKRNYDIIFFHAVPDFTASKLLSKISEIELSL